MAKHIHWTQRPENAAKVAALSHKNRARSSRPNKPMNHAESAFPLIEKHKELQMQVNFRLREIDEEISTLQQERKQLVETFNLGNE